MAPVDSAATDGFGNAAAYDAHRPSYPAEAVSRLLGHLGVAGQAGARVVDLAAGTGKFTELLAARAKGFDVVAVEPVAAMRATLAAKRLRGVAVRDGVATAMPVGDGWADAVVAAQSFHWFAHEEVLAEMRRVLKPRGKLGIIWNVEDYNQPRKWTASTRWEQGIKELVLNLPPAGPGRFRDDQWCCVFERQSRAADALFSTPIGEDKMAFTVWLTKERLWDRIGTLSQVAMLDGAAREALRARFDDLAGGGDGRWNDEGEIEVHGTTVAAWTERL